MRFIKYAAVASLCGTVAIGGCSSFLDSEKAVADPNNPTAATTNQLFVAAWRPSLASRKVGRR